MVKINIGKQSFELKASMKTMKAVCDDLGENCAAHIMDRLTRADIKVIYSMLEHFSDGKIPEELIDNELVLSDAIVSISAALDAWANSGSGKKGKKK